MGIKRIEEFLANQENKSGRVRFAIFLAIVLMILAALYVRPAIHTAALGDSYAQLSNDPFSPDPNPVGFRILTPLISYLLGLHGQLIIVTNLLFATIFLFLTYLYFRKIKFDPADATFATAVFAFSLVTLTTIYYGGYCDSLTYTIVLLMCWFRSRPLLISVLLFLGLLNRESIIVLVPWFMFLIYNESTNKMKDLGLLGIGLVVVAAAYWGYREWISTFRTVSYDMDYYFGPLKGDLLAMFKVSMTHQGIGLFTVFKATWFFVFVAAIYLWSKRNLWQLTSILLLIFLCWLQMFIARDSSRMLTLCFPVMIIALSYLRESNYLQFKSWAWYLLMFNLFMPQLYTYREVINLMHSTFAKLASIMLTGGAQW